MKYCLLIFLLLCGTAYAEEIRQDFIKDINGNPTYTVTDDQGQTVATISQFFLKDINGNKVYEIDKAPNLELE